MVITNIFLDAVVEEAKYLFTNVYAPAKFSSKYISLMTFPKILNIMPTIRSKEVIVGGNFNINFNPNLALTLKRIVSKLSKVYAWSMI